MIPYDLFKQAAIAVGYRPGALLRDFAFADVLASQVSMRVVPLAAFATTPASYRTAALAVVEQGPENSADSMIKFRSLGAPLVFAVAEDEVETWQIQAEYSPRFLFRFTLGEITKVFNRNRTEWNPQAILRAKSLGSIDQNHSLDIVDPDLMPMVAGKIHLKLNQLVADTILAIRNAYSDSSMHPQQLYRIVFRLLAAKALQDRNHYFSCTWNPDDHDSVMRKIESFYSLPSVLVGEKGTEPAACATAWDALKRGFSFSSICPDDLAIAFENTFLDPKTRNRLGIRRTPSNNFDRRIQVRQCVTKPPQADSAKAQSNARPKGIVDIPGTHCTPRQLADYAVSRLKLDSIPLKKISIYEPFAGSGIFLVSALRHLRDLLPFEWNDRKRHEFLVRRLVGDEIDPFACEVAKLSLSLADYPNRNGWQIHQRDLFAQGALEERMRGKSVILCNPPFDGTANGDGNKLNMARKNQPIPVTVLEAALAAKPHSLAFMLPTTVVSDGEFLDQRQAIEDMYSSVELVKLPSRIFEKSGIDSSLMIASDLRAAEEDQISLVSTEIASRDQLSFFKTGKVTARRRLSREIGDPLSGELWIPPLHNLWKRLAWNPTLGDHLEVHAGIVWKSPKSRVWSRKKAVGYRHGLHACNSKNLRQFALPQPVWLDCNQDSLQGAAINLPWERPKLIVNAVALNSGSWRVAASPDYSGLVGSNHWFGMWPRDEADVENLDSYAAILNGPVANAYLASLNTPKSFRISEINSIPLPRSLPDVAKLVQEYREAGAKFDKSKNAGTHLRDLLVEIDAKILAAYSLSARLESELLDHFADARRPVTHDWENWNQLHMRTELTLSERLSGRYRQEGNWVAKLFKPLPEKEAAILRTYGI